MTKTVLLLLVSAAAAFSQPIGVGVKVGLPLNDVFEGGSNATTTFESETKRYIVGPQIELRLPAGFAIELDALYTQANFSSFSRGVNTISGVADANAWEFPLLLKKKFGGANAVAASVRPFVSVGASFRRLTDVGKIGQFITGNQSTNTANQIDKNATGFVVGGGLEVRALIFRISPEIRFTRWGTSHFTQGLSNVLDTNRNQGQFLVGFHF
jgi:opacity protein-like surface antigen